MGDFAEKLKSGWLTGSDFLLFLEYSIKHIIVVKDKFT
jgi:hypothetical protein